MFQAPPPVAPKSNPVNTPKRSLIDDLDDDLNLEIEEVGGFY
jgi:hypothetical protein